MRSNSPSSVPHAPVPPSRKSIVPAVDRAATILDLLMIKAPQALSLSEIHRSLDLNKSTAYSILEALRAAGLAERGTETGKWSLGFKTLELGLSYFRSSSPFSRFGKAGAAIREACRESVYYAVLRGGKVLILAALGERSHALTIDFLPGDSVPANRSALGIALLSGQGEGEIRSVCAEGGLSAQETETLALECSRARDNGYAFTNTEREAGVCGIAVPVSGPSGRIRASIGMAVPASRMDLERRAELAAALMRGAEELSDDATAPEGPFAPGDSSY